MRRRVLAASALGVVLVAAIIAASLPPRAIATSNTESPDIVRGAYHIHTVRSDGSGTPDEVAEAASRAGLQFVILTDHGDGTRAPDPPRYHAGVLVVDAVELNTGGGHVAALGLPAAPYPLAGTPEAVIEDVHRLGGMAIAAHPGSPREALRWTGWQAPIDGLEWLNADSEWRDEQWRSLGLSMVTYLFRPRETLATLLDRPDAVVQAWDAMTRTRPVVALAGADAHARLGLRPDAEGDTGRVHVPMPGYEGSFSAFSNHVQLDAPWSGDAAADARALVDAIRRGRVFTVIDGIATPGGLRFAVNTGDAEAPMGSVVPVDRARLHAEVAAPPGTRLELKQAGTVVATSTSSSIEFDASGRPGAYRLEAYVGDGPGPTSIPWMVSNPIYVGLTPAIEAAAAEVPEGTPIALDSAAPEKGRACTSEVDVAEAGLTWRYALAGGRPSGQFGALQLPVRNGLAGVTAIRLRVRGAAPSRLWLQVRLNERDRDERWGSTFYVDERPRDVVVRLDRLRPIGPTSSDTPPWARVSSILIVADTVNTLPGTMGSAIVDAVSLVR